jgi:hypothetical protein
MAVLTGAGGALRFRNQRVGKVRDWSLNVERSALDTSCLGTFDRTYVSGLRGASGSATVLYDTEDTAARALLNSIFEDHAEPEAVDFVMDVAQGGGFSCVALVTSVSPAVSTGEVTAVSVNFQVSGPISGGF